MSHPIYYIVSVIIGTAIILILVRLVTFTSEENIYSMKEAELVMETLTTQEILEYHLKKIGFRVGNNPIIEADSSKIKFRSDEDNDGFLDILEIKLDEPAENSENPNDYKLILTRNDVQEIIASKGVTKLKLEFFDVNGKLTNEKMFIKSIKVYLRMESDYKSGNQYLFYELSFIVKPRNLI